MIPIAIPAALKAVPWRLVGWAAVVAAVALAGWRVSAWRAAYVALPGVQEALALEESCEDGSRCYERQRALEEAASHATVVAVESYEAELASLRARPARTGPVRLCIAPDGGAVRVPAFASGTHGDSAGGVLDRSHGGDYQPGPDIGPALRQYAKEVEALSASKRAIVRRDEALSQLE